jgi:hypothetical protein
LHHAAGSARLWGGSFSSKKSNKGGCGQVILRIVNSMYI